VKKKHAQSWQQSIDVSLDDRGSAIVATPDGGVIFLGQDFEMENVPYTLVRCDQEGDTIWTKTHLIANNDIEVSRQILLTNDQKIIVSGVILNPIGNTNKIFIREHNANGDIIGEKIIQLEDAVGITCRALIQNSSGDYIIGGVFNKGFGLEAFCLMIDDSGDISWQINEIVDFWPEHAKIIQANDGNFIFFQASFNEYTILKFTGDGQIIDIVSEYAPTGPFNLTGSLLDIVPHGDFGAILLEREQLLFYNGDGGLSAAYHTAPLDGEKIIRNQWDSYYIIGNLDGTEDLALAKINANDPDPEDILVWTKNLESDFEVSGNFEDEDFLHLFFENEEASLGEQVCINLRVKNFIEIVGAQFSIQYDPNAMSFVSVGNFGLAGLNENVMGLPGVETDHGILTAAWTDPTFSGTTLVDNSILFEICFEVINEFDYSLTSVVNEPISIQFINEQSQVVPFQVQSGVINAGEEYSKNIKGTTIVNDTSLLILSDYWNETFKDFHLLKLDFNQIMPTSNIFGKLFIDENSNCNFDDTEATLWESWIVQLVDEEGNIEYTTTQADGSYFFTAPIGNYTISVFFPFDFWITCPLQEIEMLNTGEDFELNIGIRQGNDCAYLEAYTSSSNFRPCMAANVALHYTNLSFFTANNVLLEMQLDPAILIQEASLPFLDLGNNVFQFELGNLPAGSSGVIYLSIFIDCDVEVGSALCITSQISADNDCISQYEGAVLATSASCNDTEIQFNIENVGSADMLQPTSYLVIEDNIILMYEELDLDAGEDILVPIEVQPFSTYRIEVLQESNFPSYLGDTISAISLENCNGLTAGLVNAFPTYDGAPYWDRYCKEVTGSYDPNDKQALPTGLEEEHYIPKNTQLKYTIRFQNTGNDTAFTVILRDQLSEHLDVSSFRPGAASHPYSVDIEGNGELQFTFNNILLPDSTTNEMESQGFVQFEIDQKDNLPIGTTIYNEAAIFFDFNEPIITNETWHTIGENYLEVISSNTEEPKRDQIKISPNPFKEEFVVDIDWELKQGQLLFYNIDGSEIGKWQLNSHKTVIQIPTLPSGIYFFQIKEDNIILYEGKLIKVE
jgi:hypothetical protein